MHIMLRPRFNKQEDGSGSAVSSPTAGELSDFTTFTLDSLLNLCIAGMAALMDSH